MKKEQGAYAYSSSVCKSLNVGYSVMGAIGKRMYAEMKPILEPVVREEISKIRINVSRNK